VREQIFRTNSLPFQRLHSHSHLKLKSHSHISSNSQIPPIPTRQLKRDIMLCAKSRLQQILIKVVRLIFQLSMLAYFSSAQLAQSQTVAPPALLPLLHVTRLCKNRRLFTVAGDKVVRRFSNSHVLTAIPIPRSVRLSVRLSLLLGYTWGEVTSHNLWSQYDRHFVGTPRYNALRFIVLFK